MNKEINNVTYIENYDSVPVVRFHPFDDMKWLNCGFSTRIGGVSTGCHSSLNLGFERGDDRKNVIHNFKLFSESAGFDVNRICLPAQWHTNNIRIAHADDCAVQIFNSDTNLRNGRGNITEEEKLRNAIDGQITDEQGIVLIAYGADCTSVYLADPKHHAIGLVHSGWKGTLNSITVEALRLMNREFQTAPEDVVAVIGPSISSENYEVGFDVAGHFIRKHNIVVTGYSPIVKTGIREGKYQLDLWEANRANLLNANVRFENIHISGMCTFKEEELFYSHRRDGNARGVMAAFMSINIQ